MRLGRTVLGINRKTAALITAPHPEQVHFQHLELINTFGRQVLMVLVLAGGEVSQQMLVLAEPVTQEKLSFAAQRLNGLCRGLGAAEIKALGQQLDALEQDVIKLVVVDMQRAVGSLSGEVYRDGLSHVLSEPEFGEVVWFVKPCGFWRSVHA